MYKVNSLNVYCTIHMYNNLSSIFKELVNKIFSKNMTLMITVKKSKKSNNSEIKTKHYKLQIYMEL